MKRYLASILLMLLATSTLFAFTDSFRDNLDKDTHNSLLKVVKDNEEPSIVMPLYESWIETEKDPVDLARMEYHMARYWKDRGDEDAGNAHISSGWDYYNDITETGLRKELPQAELTSAEYYVNGGMGKGMESSNMMKELYKKYPEEIAIVLQEANRLLYTPHIAGGSPKRALSLFETLLPVEDGLQEIDHFNLLSGLGVASEKRNKDKDALSYLERAMEIYTGDPVILETLEDLK